MLRLAFALAIAAAALSSAPTTAAADLLSLYAQVHAGGSSGKGLGGDLKDDAFHDANEFGLRLWLALQMQAAQRSV